MKSTLESSTFMTKLKPSILLSFIILFLIISCNKVGSERPGSVLKSNKEVIDLPAERTRDTFLVITSNVRWKLSNPTNANWFRLSQDSGIAGVDTVYVRADMNITNTTRSAEILLTSPEQPVNPIKITVNQKHDLEISGFDGRAKGGATINIYGRGFSIIPSQNLVTINGKNAIVQSSAHTSLQVTVPPMAGSGPLIVTVADLSDTSDMNFIYEWVGVVTVFAGGQEGYLDGIGTAAKFKMPQGIEFDESNNLYVADYANYKVRKITPSGLVSTLPGRIPPWNNPSGSNSDFSLPTAADTDGNGNVYVVEINSNTISKIAPSDVVGLFVGGMATGLQNGVGTATAFYHPIDLAIDGAGNMYIADSDNYCIRKITSNAVVTTFAGGWPGGYAEGTGINARFNRPFGIDIDASGNLYVTDHFNDRIRKITSAGQVTTYAGTGSFGSNDGPALTHATFDEPISITVAPNGTIYVSESDSDRIRIINPKGIVESITSFTEEVSGAPFQFKGIYGLAVNINGVLYASDCYNNRICRVTYK